MKIKKGDNVRIRSGKDKGKTGKILVVFPKTERLIVENVNMQTRHRRSRKQGQKGEKVLVAMPFAASAVYALCSSCHKPTRIGFRFDDNKKKIRICKKCNTPL